MNAFGYYLHQPCDSAAEALCIVSEIELQAASSSGHSAPPSHPVAVYNTIVMLNSNGADTWRSAEAAAAGRTAVRRSLRQAARHCKLAARQIVRDIRKATQFKDETYTQQQKRQVDVVLGRRDLGVQATLQRVVNAAAKGDEQAAYRARREQDLAQAVDAVAQLDASDMHDVEAVREAQERLANVRANVAVFQAPAFKRVNALRELTDHPAANVDEELGDTVLDAEKAASTEVWLGAAAAVQEPQTRLVAAFVQQFMRHLDSNLRKFMKSANTQRPCGISASIVAYDVLGGTLASSHVGADVAVLGRQVLTGAAVSEARRLLDARAADMLAMLNSKRAAGAGEAAAAPTRPGHGKPPSPMHSVDIDALHTPAVAAVLAHAPTLAFSGWPGLPASIEAALWDSNATYRPPRATQAARVAELKRLQRVAAMAKALAEHVGLPHAVALEVMLQELPVEVEHDVHAATITVMPGGTDMPRQTRQYSTSAALTITDEDLRDAIHPADYHRGAGASAMFDSTDSDSDSSSVSASSDELSESTRSWRSLTATLHATGEHGATLAASHHSHAIAQAQLTRSLPVLGLPEHEASQRVHSSAQRILTELSPRCDLDAYDLAGHLLRSVIPVDLGTPHWPHAPAERARLLDRIPTLVSVAECVQAVLETTISAAHALDVGRTEQVLRARAAEAAAAVAASEPGAGAGPELGTTPAPVPTPCPTRSPGRMLFARAASALSAWRTQSAASSSRPTSSHMAAKRRLAELASMLLPLRDHAHDVRVLMSDMAAALGAKLGGSGSDKSAALADMTVQAIAADFSQRVDLAPQYARLVAVRIHQQRRRMLQLRSVLRPKSSMPVSRTLAHPTAQPDLTGILNTPAVSAVKIDVGRDQFVITASAGVWAVLSSREVTDIVSQVWRDTLWGGSHSESEPKHTRAKPGVRSTDALQTTMASGHAATELRLASCQSMPHLRTFALGRPAQPSLQAYREEAVLANERWADVAAAGRDAGDASWLAQGSMPSPSMASTPQHSFSSSHVGMTSSMLPQVSLEMDSLQQAAHRHGAAHAARAAAERSSSPAEATFIRNRLKSVQRLASSAAHAAATPSATLGDAAAAAAANAVQASIASRSSDKLSMLRLATDQKLAAMQAAGDDLHENLQLAARKLTVAHTRTEHSIRFGKQLHDVKLARIQARREQVAQEARADAEPNTPQVLNLRNVQKVLHGSVERAAARRARRVQLAQLRAGREEQLLGQRMSMLGTPSSAAARRLLSRSVSRGSVVTPPVQAVRLSSLRGARSQASLLEDAGPEGAQVAEAMAEPLAMLPAAPGTAEETDELAPAHPIQVWVSAKPQRRRRRKRRLAKKQLAKRREAKLALLNKRTFVRRQVTHALAESPLMGPGMTPAAGSATAAARAARTVSIPPSSPTFKSLDVGAAATAVLQSDHSSDDEGAASQFSELFVQQVPPLRRMASCHIERDMTVQGRGAWRSFEPRDITAPHAMQACLMSAAFRRAVLSSALTRADEQSQQRAKQLGRSQHAKRAHTIDTLAPEATTAWRRKQLQLVAMAAAARVGEEARARQQYRAGVLGSTLDFAFQHAGDTLGPEHTLFQRALKVSQPTILVVVAPLSNAHV